MLESTFHVGAASRGKVEVYAQIRNQITMVILEWKGPKNTLDNIFAIIFSYESTWIGPWPLLQPFHA
jgi:hypothetical protein